MSSWRDAAIQPYARSASRYARRHRSIRPSLLLTSLTQERSRREAESSPSAHPVEQGFSLRRSAEPTGSAVAAGAVSRPPSGSVAGQAGSAARGVP